MQKLVRPKSAISIVARIPTRSFLSLSLAFSATKGECFSELKHGECGRSRAQNAADLRRAGRRRPRGTIGRKRAHVGIRFLLCSGVFSSRLIYFLHTFCCCIMSHYRGSFTVSIGLNGASCRRRQEVSSGVFSRAERTRFRRRQEVASLRYKIRDIFDIIGGSHTLCQI